MSETKSETRLDIFNTLFKIDVSEHVEKKNGLSYLSWPWAWAEVKKLYPRSFYTIYEKEDGRNYFDDGRTCWVKTGVSVVDGDYSLEHIEELPIMDYKNNSIPVDKVTSYDVNKAIQRSLTKACARHGLGLYIYAGEDLPEEAKQQKEEEAKQAEAAKKKASQELDDLRQQVIEAATQKINEEKIPQEAVYQIIMDLNNGKKNPNSIKSVSVMKKVLAAIQEMKVST